MKTSKSVEKSNIIYEYLNNDASAAYSQELDLSSFGAESIAIQVAAAGILTADSSIVVEESNDRVNWFQTKDQQGSGGGGGGAGSNDLIFALAAGATNLLKRMQSNNARYMRFRYVQGTNTAGTFSIYVFMKHR